MRLKLIACKVMAREIGRLAAESDNFVDITYLRQGLHNEPGKLREVLQREIDAVDAGADLHTCAPEARDFDAILLGYGLCSGGVKGIHSKKYPIVIPRAHDCITLFLGSGERYLEYFNEKSGGIYWYTPGWIENAPMPSKETEESKSALYREKYGEDNAAYLMEAERSWISDYRCIAYVGFPGLPQEKFREYAMDAASYFGLPFEEYRGDDGLLNDFLGGKWDGVRFLVVPPGRRIEPSFDETILKGEEPEG